MQEFFVSPLSSEKHKSQFSRLIWLLLTLINPVSVPQKIMSFAVNKLVILLPADSLPTFCCFSLNHIYHKFRSRIRTRESCIFIYDPSDSFYFGCLSYVVARPFELLLFCCITQSGGSSPTSLVSKRKRDSFYTLTK